MDNKTLFIEAHKIARSTVAEVGDYQIAFSLALKDLRSQEQQKVNVNKVVNFENVFDFLGGATLMLICSFLVTFFVCGIGLAAFSTGVVAYKIIGLVLIGGGLSLGALLLEPIRYDFKQTKLPHTITFS